MRAIVFILAEALQLGQERPGPRGHQEALCGLQLEERGIRNQSEQLRELGMRVCRVHDVVRLGNPNVIGHYWTANRSDHLATARRILW
jgi:hypothetical protein